MPSAPSFWRSPFLRPAGWPQPLAAVRRIVNAWWLARLPCSDSLTLTQRNVYILPTRAGLMFGVTLLVLLIASINYQLSLGYVLTFLLAGSGVVSMHLTHATLRGLTAHLRPPPAVFAGDSAPLHIGLACTQRARHGIGLRLLSAAEASCAWSDVPEAGHSQTTLHLLLAQRGLHAVPGLVLQTRFPLGLFRAWSIWRPAAQVLAYPRPEHPAPPLPVTAAHSTVGQTPSRTPSGEPQGVRAYQPGDPLKRIAWKKSASTLARSGELVSRDTVSSASQQLWLEWQHCGGLAPEARLSRLAAWVLMAQGLQADYGLRLPGTEIAPAQGDAQRERCLRALALWTGVSP